MNARTWAVALCRFDSILNPISEVLYSRVHAGNLWASTADAVADDADLIVEEVAVDVEGEHEWTALKDWNNCDYDLLNNYMMQKLTLSPWHESFPLKTQNNTNYIKRFMKLHNSPFAIASAHHSIIKLFLINQLSNRLIIWSTLLIADDWNLQFLQHIRWLSAFLSSSCYWNVNVNLTLTLTVNDKTYPNLECKQWKVIERVIIN